MFKAKDAMTRTVVAVHEDSSADEAIELLLRHHVSGLPVIDADDHVVGIVTEFDLLARLYRDTSAQTQVWECMSRDVQTVDEEQALTDIIDLLLSRRFRRVPVVSNGRLVGVIGRRDVMRVICETRKRMRNHLERDLHESVSSRLLAATDD